jgi:hypothetical protein
MSLRTLQCHLARLVTDPDVRTRFLADPAEAARTERWDPDLARALATIAPDSLRHYGESLLRKRCHEAARCLPLTYRALGSVRFRDWLLGQMAWLTTCGSLGQREGAVAFARALLRSRTAMVPKTPVWIASLAAYEAAPLCFRDPRRCFSILRIGYHPRDLVNAALAVSPVTEIPVQPCLVLWFRLRRCGKAGNALSMILIPLMIPRGRT